VTRKHSQRSDLTRNICSDYNGNCPNMEIAENSFKTATNHTNSLNNSDYAELKNLRHSNNKRGQGQQPPQPQPRSKNSSNHRVSRSKSRGGFGQNSVASNGSVQMATNSGILTVWPGSRGIWLPQ
jgi:hypothetical protein